MGLGDWKEVLVAYFVLSCIQIICKATLHRGQFVVNCVRVFMTRSESLGGGGKLTFYVVPKKEIKNLAKVNFLCSADRLTLVSSMCSTNCKRTKLVERKLHLIATRILFGCAVCLFGFQSQKLHRC